PEADWSDTLLRTRASRALSTCRPICWITTPRPMKVSWLTCWSWAGVSSIVWRWYPGVEILARLLPATSIAAWLATRPERPIPSAPRRLIRFSRRHVERAPRRPRPRASPGAVVGGHAGNRRADGLDQPVHVADQRLGGAAGDAHLALGRSHPLPQL